MRVSPGIFVATTGKETVTPPAPNPRLPDNSLQLQEASFPPEVGVLGLRMVTMHREARQGHGEDRFLATFLSTWLQPCWDHPLDILIL